MFVEEVGGREREGEISNVGDWPRGRNRRCEFFHDWPWARGSFLPLFGSLDAPSQAPDVTLWSLVPFCGLRCIEKGSAAPAQSYRNFDGGGPLAATSERTKNASRLF